jgi:hypothetical protein
MAEEDRYAARVARDYGIFVENRPFYEFPFFHALRGLWSGTRFWGQHPLRKWERKAWLSLDYGIEAIYCGVIRAASHAVYGIEEEATYAWVEHVPEAALSSITRVQELKPLGADSFIIRMPRYQKFTDTAVELLRSGARFAEIAGNRQIMVTAVVPRRGKLQVPAGELLFASQILTDGLSERVALRVPVSELGTVLAKLPIEHIYDY